MRFNAKLKNNAKLIEITEIKYTCIRNYTKKQYTNLEMINFGDLTQ